MTVVAVLHSGEAHRLAAALGDSPKEIAERLIDASLTGSAAPLADAWLETEDGRQVRYGDIDELRAE